MNIRIITEAGPREYRDVVVDGGFNFIKLSDETSGAVVAIFRNHGFEDIEIIEDETNE